MQAHEVADDLARDEARSRFVADLRGATDQRLLLPDATPLAREHPDPDLVREVVQLFANPCQFAGAVVVHRASCHTQQTLLRRGQPVRDRQVVEGIATELGAEPVRERNHRHVMGAGHVVPAEHDRPAAVFGREAVVDSGADRGDIGRLDEDLQAGSPAVVGRPFGVEAEQLGAVPEQRATVGPRAVRAVRRLLGRSRRSVRAPERTRNSSGHSYSCLTAISDRRTRISEKRGPGSQTLVTTESPKRRSRSILSCSVWVSGSTVYG